MDFGGKRFRIVVQVKKLNKEAGLNSFVLLVGTGLQNVHMSIEALQRLEI